MRLVVGIVITLAITWALFLVVLAVLRPKGMNLSEAKRLVPDVARLIRDLANDKALPTGLRRRLGLLVVYLALPFDFVPDFIPVLGYADDVIVIGIVLRSVMKAAGPAALDRHWSGSEAGLALTRRLAGLA
jgi:uncharacterized membrane protein YkvA (DUF1232 family)